MNYNVTVLSEYFKKMVNWIFWNLSICYVESAIKLFGFQAAEMLSCNFLILNYSDEIDY